MRRAWLDNLRWATVLLVVAYHVCYLFNGVGILGGIPRAGNLPACDFAAGMVYPWFMVLLFAAAGMSARYSLEKRAPGAFLRERVRKLVVPATLGLFVVHWVTGYMNIKMGGGLEYIPRPLVYPISVLSGIGPLWFIQMLFLFSCLLAAVRKLGWDRRLLALGEKANLPVLVGLVLVIFAGAQVLNLPVLTMYRFGIYLAAFFIGYFVLSHDRVQETLQKACIPLLCGAVLCGAWYGWLYAGGNFTDPACLQSPVTNLYLWLTALGLMGAFGRFFDRETPFTRRMSSHSFGVYVLHYPVLIVVCWFLSRSGLPVAAVYLAALLIGSALTFALTWLVSRLPVVRWLVLGKKGVPVSRISPP